VLITTPVNTKSVYLNSKLIKFTKLVFKGKLLVGPDFIATQEGIYDVIITKK
jgi:hypothetical protein